MKIAAQTRFKQGDIVELMRKIGWTVPDLAKKAGLSKSAIYDVVNLKRRPTKEVAEKIQAAFAVAGEYLDILEVWPETFSGIHHAVVEEVREIRDEDLRLLHNPETKYLQICDLEYALESNTEREKAMMMEYANGNTFQEIGESSNVSTERVRQIIADGFRKARRRIENDLDRSETGLNRAISLCEKDAIDIQEMLANSQSK